jgi:adenosylcobalamin-dependent ribonucleoside-triphosphate reductase
MSAITLTDNFIEQYKRRKPKWGYGELGKLVYKRSYARKKENGKREEWWETVRRVVEGCYSEQIFHCQRYGLPYDRHKAQLSGQKMYDLIFNFKFLPPGRGLEHMGAPSLEKKGAAVLNNCAFISTDDLRQDAIRPFTFLMDMSMLGVGVASDCRGAGKLTVKGAELTNSSIFQIEDSREGWVASLAAILEAWFYGRPRPMFDYSLLRKEGEPLKTFGGTASGPGPLNDMHCAIDAILEPLRGKLITSTAIVDIFNWVGRCVVSGGARRTAELILGLASDADFFRLKDPNLFKEELLSHRWASNNSCMASMGMDYSPFIDQIAENGEPGFFWLENAQHYGRMKDGYGDWDVGVFGTNPCGEQSLESGEVCNLVEVFPAHHDSLEELQQTLKFAYLYAKTVTLVPTHDLRVNSVIGRNRRIGTSVTGIAQSIEKFGFRNFVNALDRSYSYIRELDRMYSRWLCVPTSIKVTTVKPSGTVSLVAGATPGMHFPHSEYYIRNVRLNTVSSLIEPLEKAGYKIEPSAYGDNTVVVSFPVHEKNFLRSKSDVSALEQLELAAALQHYWSDNQVSATISFRPEEIEKLKLTLPMYEHRLKSVSFLPLDNHQYVQAPYITIQQQEYEKLMEGITPIDFRDFSDQEESDKFCSNDSCVLK